MLLNILASSGSEATSSTADSGASLESLGEIFKNPILWAVVGGIVVLILIVYILRRIVRPQAGVWKIIERGGKLHKIIDGNSKLIFMIPVKDKMIASVADNTKNFASDKLYINDGPDALYKLTYAIEYKVKDINNFYPIIERLDNTLAERINDDLRTFADMNGAELILRSFKENKDKIIAALNESFDKNGIEILGFKIKSIEPLGKK